MRNKKNILVVDLDRSLIRSDMLYETFWSAFSINWRIFLRAFFLIFTSRLKLKDYLYRQSDVDVATLPYNKKVMAIIRARQAMGHKIVMATATHHQLAKKIASHLGLFDDVHGSDQTNLRGQHKADAILNAYPEASIEYIGDHTTDLQLWRKSDRAISVDAGPRLRRQIEDIGIAFEHLDTAPKTGLALIKSLRLYQWSKNALVFVPMIASHEFTLEVFLLSIMAFVSFGMIASCMYIFNDLCDLKSDRVHDRKKKQTLCVWDGENRPRTFPWLRNEPFWTSISQLCFHPVFLLHAGLPVGSSIVFGLFKTHFDRRSFRVGVPICDPDHRGWSRG